jgi:hypothetical protein
LEKENNAEAGGASGQDEWQPGLLLTQPEKALK